MRSLIRATRICRAKACLEDERATCEGLVAGWRRELGRARSARVIHRLLYQARHLAPRCGHAER
eukprot:scaffold104031_cov33-Tisochrysis_lutea.AAC.2